jgi:uncharacterized membrane protein YeaQ/YmgE (transglycosylase-associated protein family)
MGIFSWIVLGLITGWSASKIVNKTGSGMMMDMALGVVGAIVGGFLAGPLGIGGVNDDNIGSIILAVIGAVVVLLVYDVLEASLRKLDTSFAQFVSNLTVGILGQANPAAPSENPLDPRSDIDAVARQTAVGLFDHIAQMNADAKFDATVLRHAQVALDHSALDFNRAADRVDHAAEFDEAPIAGAFDHAPVVRVDGRINQIAAQPPEARQRAILVGPGQTAVSDHVGNQNRRYLALAMFRCHVGFPPVPVDK